MTAPPKELLLSAPLAKAGLFLSLAKMAASSSSITEDPEVDGIIEKLLEVRGSRPGKQVNLSEQEIRNLCTKAREIFMNQPVLLELEAPIKICGARDPRGLPTACHAQASLRSC